MGLGELFPILEQVALDELFQSDTFRIALASSNIIPLSLIKSATNSTQKSSPKNLNHREFGFAKPAASFPICSAK